MAFLSKYNRLISGVILVLLILCIGLAGYCIYQDTQAEPLKQTSQYVMLFSEDNRFLADDISKDKIDAAYKEAQNIEDVLEREKRTEEVDLANKMFLVNQEVDGLYEDANGLLVPKNNLNQELIGYLETKVAEIENAGKADFGHSLRYKISLAQKILASDQIIDSMYHDGQNRTQLNDNATIAEWERAMEIVNSIENEGLRVQQTENFKKVLDDLNRQ